MPHAPHVLEQISRVLAATPCQHCGRPPYHPVSESETTPDAAALDAVDAAEERLWRQLDEGAKVRGAAPPEPSPDQLAVARKALADAKRAERALQEQMELAEKALADPRGWLRFNQRMTVAGQLAEDRNAVPPIRAQVAAAEKRVRELEQRRDRGRVYLARYRRVLEVSDAAREELDRLVDELVHGYASLPVPPPWFTLGLGYPPKPEEYEIWLRRARAVIAYRRRYGVNHPLEPLGRVVPEQGTAQHKHWKAAQKPPRS
ncbi:MAG: hypothetical protein GEU94_18775 [Micromonosporaceae bacterium]|nr:hypothetical protein [Micromonosporaceae bacterium]